MVKVTIANTCLVAPKFESDLDFALWVIDRALDALWHKPGLLDVYAYYLLRNASYHLQGKHNLCIH